VSTPDPLAEILDRIAQHTHTAADLAALGEALHAGSMRIEASQDSVAIGGNVTNAVIIAGRGHTVTLNIDPAVLRGMIEDAMRTVQAQPFRPEELEALAAEYLHNVVNDPSWTMIEAGGVQIPLTDVYVCLQAVAVPPPRPLEPRPDIAEMPERMEHANLGGVIDRTLQKGAPQVKEDHLPSPPVPLAQALKDAQHLTLLGEPGAGKSITLQFIGLCLATSGWAESRLGLAEMRLPLRVALRAWAGEFDHPGFQLETTLAQALIDYLPSLSGDVGRARALLGIWLTQGRLCILLDGLDEVSDQQRSAARQQIGRFVAAAGGSKGRIVVASRLAGYTPLGSDFKDYTLKPFQQAEDALPYLENWLTALRPQWPRPEACRQADMLLEEMNAHPALHRLTDNPLVLRLAAEAYALTGKVVRNRAELYKQYLEVAWQRAETRGTRPEYKATALARLENLAWRMQRGDEVTVKDLSLEEMAIEREKMGLLVRFGERWAFSHTTFHEYFVARRLWHYWEKDPRRVWKYLRPRLHLPAWREPLLLLSGLLEDARADALSLQVLRAHSCYEI